jgi:hypothetical protein
MEYFNLNLRNFMKKIFLIAIFIGTFGFIGLNGMKHEQMADEIREEIKKRCVNDEECVFREYLSYSIESLLASHYNQKISEEEFEEEIKELKRELINLDFK